MVLSQKLISRYRELRQEAKDCVLLMQVGAFMTLLIKSLENELAYNMQPIKTHAILYMAWHVVKKAVNQQTHLCR